MKTELTKEQSQHLIDLGVPKDKASGSTYTLEPDYAFSYARDFRCFSITDLLEILPKEIDIKDKALFLKIQMINEVCSVYYEYFTRVGCRAFYEAEELIDALYELTVWCIENGHLKFD